MEISQRHRFSFTTFVPVLFLLIFLIFQYSEVQGQEIGIEYGVNRSGYNNVLERPTGIGGYVDMPLFSDIGSPVIAGVDFRLAVSRHTENLTVSRPRCTGLVDPEADCSNDTFDGDSHIIRLGAGMVVGFQPFLGSIRPELYALATNSHLDVDFIGRQSGKNISPITPSGRNLGYEVGGTINYKLTRFLDLYGRFSMQDPNIQTCGYDAWFAFCEEKRWFQLSLGTQFQL